MLTFFSLLAQSFTSRHEKTKNNFKTQLVDIQQQNANQKISQIGPATRSPNSIIIKKKLKISQLCLSVLGNMAKKPSNGQKWISKSKF